jgi:hypothetical protein
MPSVQTCIRETINISSSLWILSGKRESILYHRSTGLRNARSIHHFWLLLPCAGACDRSKTLAALLPCIFTPVLHQSIGGFSRWQPDFIRPARSRRYRNRLLDWTTCIGEIVKDKKGRIVQEEKTELRSRRRQGTLAIHPTVNDDHRLIWWMTIAKLQS